jgi:hypothetical protein
LERLREELRNRGYLPIIFNFDKPETKNSLRLSGCSPGSRTS